MAFPEDPIDVSVELDLDGTWTDITEYVLVEDGITITRGRSPEAATVEPSSCELSLLNTDGRFSPRNPQSPYYGSIGRNTPLRVSLNQGDLFAQLDGTSGCTVSTPDDSSLDITGDIDIRIEFTPGQNPWGFDTTMLSKYAILGNQRSWAVWRGSEGMYHFRWSTGGTLASAHDAVSTLPAPWHEGRQAFRLTFDVDNGSSESVVTFYTSDSISGPWAQLGEEVVTTGVASIFNSTSPITIGDNVDPPLLNTPWDARVYKVEIYNGINGTLVTNPDFTVQTAGDTSFTDTVSSPRTWTMNGSSEITNKDLRFVGEVSAWPPKWGLSGNVVKSTIEVSGVLRRLGQGTRPTRSALYRFLSDPNLSSVVGYWPLEDGEDATGIAPGRPRLTPGTIVGSPQMASYSDYLASDSLPSLDATGGYIFNLPFYSVNAGSAIRFFFKPTDDGPGAVTRLISVRTTGTAARWEIELSADGHSYQIRAYDVNGESLLTDGFNSILSVDFGEPVFVNLFLTEDGSDVDYNLQVYELGQIPAITVSLNRSGTLSGKTVGRVHSVMVGPSGGLEEHVIGHMVVTNVSTALGLTEPLGAHIGEATTDRLVRLSGEESLNFTKVGFSEGALMGAQTADNLSGLLQECEDADLGLLFEPRTVLGIGYRDSLSLMNQSARLTLDYSAAEVAGDLEPIDDDQHISNVVTAERLLGSMFTVEQEMGPLSTLTPPNGVGRYEDSVQVSLATEEQLQDAAGWRLNLGTVDEARFPRIGVDLARNTALAGDATQMDIGSRVVVTDLPLWVSFDEVSQIVQGYTEYIENYRHHITFNCTPESPYRVATLDSDVLGHADTEGSELVSEVTSTATSLSVSTTSGPIWTTDVDDLPFDVIVGGEQMTVTAISGSSSPQTFTVTRSVNGVVKTHSSGTEVRLWQPMILAY